MASNVVMIHCDISDHLCLHCMCASSLQALSRRPKIETASMRAGTKVHEAMEAEVVTRVELEITSAEVGRGKGVR